jgi:hypothetical protein
MIPLSLTIFKERCSNAITKVPIKSLGKEDVPTFSQLPRSLMTINSRG